MIILIDYGHGGMINGRYRTAGKQYTFVDHENHHVYEGVLNRQIAAWLMNDLRDAGFHVVDVLIGERAPVGSWRDLEQRDVPLEERVRRANSFGQQSLYLSIHSNALASDIRGSSTSARGTTFYTSTGSTQSNQIANILAKTYSQSKINNYIPLWEHPLKEANFYVLRKTIMPAVLGEVGFFTNWEDAQALQDPSCQQLIAEMYCNALVRWCAHDN